MRGGWAAVPPRRREDQRAAQEPIRQQPQGSSTAKTIGTTTRDRSHLGAPNSTQPSPDSSTEEIKRPTKRDMDTLGAPNTPPKRSYVEETRGDQPYFQLHLYRHQLVPLTRRRSPHKDPPETLVKTPCSQTNVCNDLSDDSPQRKTTSEPRPKEQDTQTSRRPRRTKQNGGF
ncbi:hypothetical protein ElyMa_002484700 [Elysia marginata]|uniref:Uncharacterized protein n=1 Tax=Elysia marginata TaxID=1093978 RepID=A0AAV4GQ69_9GAST|nr:hypothetical protein ElyMa_002484700 [Elysia marginata]